MKRRLEFVAGSSAKFYEVSVEGSIVATRFGRIGSEGQSQTKSFGDQEATAKHADKVIREKLAKGYVETAPGVALGDSA